MHIQEFLGRHGIIPPYLQPKGVRREAVPTETAISNETTLVALRSLDGLKFFEDVPAELRPMIFDKCDFNTLGQLFLTSKEACSEAANPLVKKVKGAESYNIQSCIRDKSPDPLKRADSWIRAASSDIEHLEFNANEDLNWMECLSELGNKKVEKVIIRDLRPAFLDVEKFQLCMSQLEEFIMVETFQDVSNEV